MQNRKNPTHEWAGRLISISFAALATLGLQGCQDGVSTENLPTPTTGGSGSAYNGEEGPRTDDVQNFLVSLWTPLHMDGRCVTCHGTGGTDPKFVRGDNINLAYEAVNPYINRAQPEASLLVTKVANGHNCWLPDDGACASSITRFIMNWLNSDGDTGREIQLDPPPEHLVGESKQFPADSTLFATYVHPILRQYCVECHNESATAPQSPYFAEADVDVAYAAVKTSIDLDTPSNSRLVQRLLELHNCWGDCPANAQEMETAITNMADNILPTPIDENLLVSQALALKEPDAIVASGGSRHETDLVALYEFKTGNGSTAYDTSGIEPTIDLNITGSATWVKGWGIEFTGNGKAQGTTSSSSKLSQLIKMTGEYSIEAWVVPANVTQEGPARIVSYSAGGDLRNFTLGQTMYNYDFMQRSSTTDGNGEPAHSTADDDERVQASEQHVVLTFDPVNGRRIYVNGAFTGDLDETAPGSLSDWDDSYALVLGNEASSDFPWEGKIRLLAIHNRALTQSQIQQNFDAGVGEKFFLLFKIDELLTTQICDPIVLDPENNPDELSTPKNYIMFEASQFDNYSYMFRQPRYICLQGAVNSSTVPLEGMRIGINGKESSMGQGYSNLVTTIDGAAYTGAGLTLSNMATTIPLEKGADSDQFFLTFEVLDGETNVYTEPAVPTPAVPADRDPVSRVGLRTFEEVSASMSALTGVPRNNSAVAATYATIRQQLPSSEDINGFLSSHQVAVSQLAIEYCSELVDDAALRGNLFPSLNFATNANDIADATWQDQVVNPIIDRFLGQNLASQPLPADVRAELMNLLTDTADNKPYGSSGTDGIPDGLARCGGPCSADRTYIATKAACASALGSAALLLQ